jgi:hypothetical protein
MIPPWYMPHMGLPDPGNPLNTPTPDDGRTQYTGQFGAGMFNQPGNVNNNSNPANGPTLGPSGNLMGQYYGVIPAGTSQSQLGSVQNGAHYGYQGPMLPGPHFDPYAQDPSGAPLSGYYQPPGAAPAQAAPAPVVAPHAREPGRAPSNVWGGGFGLSDNSAWGNKGDAAQLSRTGINGSLQDTTNQAGTMASRPNAPLPGAGSAFGLGRNS